MLKCRNGKENSDHLLLMLPIEGLRLISISAYWKQSRKLSPIYENICISEGTL